MILKWAGNKKPYSAVLHSLLPGGITQYHMIDLFCGSAGNLAGLGRSTLPMSYLGIDNNVKLINYLSHLAKDPFELFEEVDELKVYNITVDDFYYYRGLFNDIKHDSRSAAAIFWYINRTCFNGLYRVNSMDIFNVPWNKKPYIKVPTDSELTTVKDVLKAVNARFMAANVLSLDFSSMPENTVIVVDPPYLPEVKTSFTSYSVEAFGVNEHRALVTKLKETKAIARCKIFVWAGQSGYHNSIYGGFPSYTIDRYTTMAASSNSRRYVQDMLVEIV